MQLPPEQLWDPVVHLDGKCQTIVSLEKKYGINN